MPRKKRKSISPDLPGDAQNTFKIIEIPDGDPEIDPFAALREGITDDTIRIILRRMEPTELNGIAIDGYLEDLPVEKLDRFEDYISGKYGGGVYQIEKRDSGKLVLRGRCQISGVAIVPARKNVKIENASLPDEQVDGVNLGGTNEEFEQRVMRLLAYKKLFADDPIAPPPSDINAVLLQHFLNQQSPTDLSAQLGNLQTLVEAASTIGAGQSGQTDFMDILKEGIKAVSVIANRQAPAQAPFKYKAGVMEAIKKPPLVIPAAGEPAPEQLAEQTAGEETMPVTDLKQIAAVAIANITASFRADPTITPERMVNILDNVIDVEPAIRADLGKHKTLLEDMANAQLADEIAETPEIKAQFSDFFADVFNLFTDPNREVNKL